MMSAPSGRLNTRGLAISVFVKFCLVGVTNTLLSYAVLMLALALLPEFTARAFVAQSLSYLTGVGWSFILNSRFTFGQKGLYGSTFVKFLVLQGALMVATALAFQWSAAAGLHTSFSWLVIVAVATLANFLLSKIWVFKHTRRDYSGGHSDAV